MIPLPANASPYGWLLLGGIAVTLTFWLRLARRDDRLFTLYIAALLGAFLGAKLVYLGAEGWLHWADPDRWRQWATGKSVLGALLGGYLAVEIAKQAVGYAGTTGDWFAATAPLGIVLGRVGCLFHGCCLGVVCAPAWYTLRDVGGVTRWPAVPVEILFNLIALLVFWGLRRRRLLSGQHFHLYLMAYGAFRFGHEFVREEPRILGPFSGYQVAALSVFALGLAGFIRRRRRPLTNLSPAAVPNARSHPL